jgi:5-methylcytosine-specific restriction endonuclease McrA
VTEKDFRAILAAHVARHGYVCRCTPECEESLLNGYHYDHKIPVSRGGRHSVDNLRVLAPICNLRKGAKL